MRSLRNQFTEEQFRAFVDEQPDESEQELQPYEIIHISRNLFVKSKHADLSESEREYWKDRYIKRLLDFGYRYKGDWEESGQAARDLFEDALKVEWILPIAHYRLGHIHLKRKELVDTVNHFFAALQQMNQHPDSRYIMDEIQSENAKRLLVSACKKISKMFPDHSLANGDFDDFEYANDPKPVVLWIYRNGKIDEKKPTNLSEYSDYKDRVECNPNSMYIDAYQRRVGASYRSREQYVSDTNYSLLSGILNGNLQDEMETKFLPHNSFNQRIVRLREFLERIGLVPPDFEIKKEPGRLPVVSTGIEIYWFKHIEE